MSLLLSRQMVSQGKFTVPNTDIPVWKYTCSRALCRAEAVGVYVYMRLYKELVDWDYLSEHYKYGYFILWYLWLFFWKIPALP